MDRSESIKELATALHKAQGEMSGAKKKSKNPFFKSNYADLEEVINCIKEPFFNNGLSYMQFPIATDGFAGVELIIMHISGEWISSKLMLKCAKNDPQGMGSAITYARRYTLQSAAGLPSEDDDGNAATPAAKPSYQKPVQQAPVHQAPAPPIVKVISEDQRTRLHAMANGVPDVRALIKHYGFDSSNDITTSSIKTQCLYTQIIANIKAVKKQLNPETK